MRYRTNAGDVACNFLHCGDTVYEKENPRHVGKVLSIHWGDAKVKWENGWIGELPVHDLKKIWTT
jgi:hypothetical protein